MVGAPEDWRSDAQWAGCMSKTKPGDQMMTVEDTTEVRNAKRKEVCNDRRPENQNTRITKDNEKGQLED